LTRALFVHHQHFFTFVHEEGVAPTNNVVRMYYDYGMRVYLLNIRPVR